jgi:surfeit locus 1 family protein
MSPAPAPRRLWAAGLFVALGVALCCGLGVWQLRRLAWKEELLARLEAGRAQTAQPAPAAADWPRARPEELDYRRLAARGRYEPVQALVFAGPISTPGGAVPGYFVMNVLRGEDGGRLLIHRGVIPITMIDAVPPPPQGEVEASGLARAPERPGWFTPADAPAKGAFFVRDPAALAPALGPGLSPFYLDLEAAPGEAAGWPRKGAGALAPPNNHLSYALTWFGLAGALLGVFAVWARRKA